MASCSARTVVPVNPPATPTSVVELALDADGPVVGVPGRPGVIEVVGDEVTEGVTPGTEVVVSVVGGSVVVGDVVVVVRHEPSGNAPPCTWRTSRRSPPNRVVVGSSHSGRPSVTFDMNDDQICAGNVPPPTLATPFTSVIDATARPSSPG